MPGHEGAVPGSRYRRWRVPWVGRTRAVAPCLLCEVLAVILVLRSGVALALALAWLLLQDRILTFGIRSIRSPAKVGIGYYKAVKLPAR